MTLIQCWNFEPLWGISIYVFDGNTSFALASHPRMILLMMVAVCLNGCILLEQPISSYFEFYPRFRDLIRMLQEHGGRGAVP